MEFLNSIAGYLFPFLEQIQTFAQLGKNGDTLIQEMEELRDLKRQIEQAVRGEEIQPRMKRTYEVTNWLESVDTMANQVEQFKRTFETRKTNFNGGWSNYQLSRRAVDLLNGVRDLKNKAKFDKLVSKAPPPAVELQNLPASLVGVEGMTSTVLAHLHDDEVRIIGIHGMGGVGKTTLLKNLNNALGNMATNFDLVIWVTVSQDAKVLKIQEAIATRLGCSLPSDDETSRAVALFNVLSQKKYLLLLDDMWESLDLEKIGIPHPTSHNECKIALTARPKEVGTDMGVQRYVNVATMDANDSWELFRQNIGREVDLANPSIRHLADCVVARCGGLPLALITVAKAMANATTPRDWKVALDKFQKSASEIRGMHNVLLPLKLSYDKLESDTLRQCLLYFSLYPEDSIISVIDIIEYWIGEGILDSEGYGGIDKARDQGHDIIKKLKAARLLGSVQDGELEVKMHNMVRDMAIWISSVHCDKASIGHSYAGLALDRLPPVEAWRGAKRISLANNNIEELPNLMPDCPSLLTLLMHNNSFRKPIPASFFTSFPILRVLSLSVTKIEALPGEIGLLVELEYLDVSYTPLKSLPKEIGKLTKLRILDLCGTRQLSVVPRGEILKMARLQVLNLSASNFVWDLADGDDDMETSYNNLLVLRGLEKLEDLGLTIGTSRFLHVLQQSHVWSTATKCLSLRNVDLTDADLLRTLQIMKRLQQFEIVGNGELRQLTFCNGQLVSLMFLKLRHLPILERIVLEKKEKDVVVEGFQRYIGFLPSLHTLDIEECYTLRDLHWVRQLSSLRSLQLSNCWEINELLDGGEEEETDDHTSALPNLRNLILARLPNLRSISRRPLLLPSLEHLFVCGCPALVKLPLGLQSTKKLKVIMGSQKWWDALEWEDTVKSTFLPHFVRHRGIETMEEESAKPSSSRVIKA